MCSGAHSSHSIPQATPTRSATVHSSTATRTKQRPLLCGIASQEQDKQLVIEHPSWAYQLPNIPLRIRLWMTSSLRPRSSSSSEMIGDRRSRLHVQVNNVSIASHLLERQSRSRILRGYVLIAVTEALCRCSEKTRSTSASRSSSYYITHTHHSTKRGPGASKYSTSSKFLLQLRYCFDSRLKRR